MWFDNEVYIRINLASTWLKCNYLHARQGNEKESNYISSLLFCERRRRNNDNKLDVNEELRTQ